VTTKQLIGRTFLVLVLAAVAGAAAYLLSNSQDRVYAATTKLLFSGSTPEQRAVGIIASTDEEERAIVNNVAQVGSYDIARRTAEVLDRRRLDADAIAGKVKVSAERGADIVTIEVRDDTPEGAALIATAYRREFIRRSEEVVQARAEIARKAVRDALAGLTPALRAGPRGDALRSQLASLAVVERVGGEPLVVEGIRADATAVSPLVVRDTLFGLVLGAVLGIGLVALRGATSSGRRSPTEAPAGPAPVSDETRSLRDAS
jgi:capsular polysaccharide biosynthesis protein